MRESELAVPVRRHLEELRYRVWVDPDGTDYFDVVAKRGKEVGLVELKVADWRKVAAQAIRRRGWGDWVAVTLPRESLAKKVIENSKSERAQRVGVWWVDGTVVRVAREARPLAGDGELDPFIALREEFARLLELLESGTLPEGVRWSHLASIARRAHGGRTSRDWRLDEFST